MFLSLEERRPKEGQGKEKAKKQRASATLCF